MPDGLDDGHCQMAQMPDGLEVVRSDNKAPLLSAPNPTVAAKGLELCSSIAKKVSSWFKIPPDLALLQELKRDFELRTSASGVQGLLKAILVSLIARGLDFEPELLFVSKGDVLAMIKAKLG